MASRTSPTPPEPPLNIPRIVDVKDPSANQYAVYVRMPTHLATKWPDKPWNTPIEEVGLATKDSTKYAGYTLVDIEPVKGSADLYWVFEKLSGPITTTKKLGQDSQIPAKFRSLVTTTQNKQDVLPDTEPSALTGDLISSLVKQQESSGKAVRVDTEETIEVGSSLGSIVTNTKMGVGFKIEESLVPKGTIVDSVMGDLTISGSLTSNGSTLVVFSPLPRTEDFNGKPQWFDFSLGSCKWHTITEPPQWSLNHAPTDASWYSEEDVASPDLVETWLPYTPVGGETGNVDASVALSGQLIEDLFADPDNPYWGVQSDGSIRDARQLDDHWFLVTQTFKVPEPYDESNPSRARVVNRVTPLGTDVYFTEVGAMPDEVPDYDSPHYDTVKWPNHKLSLITPEDETGSIFKFHYVADRANQDNYNWELRGGEELVRTYFIRREHYLGRSEAEWQADYDLGAPLPSSDEWRYPLAGVGSYDAGNGGYQYEGRDDRFPKFCFIDDTQLRTEKELDSIYVVIQRRFVEPSTTEFIYNDALEKEIKVLKEVIPPHDGISPSTANGTSIDIKKGNIFHDVRITQSIADGDLEWAISDGLGTRRDSFPSKLQGVKLIWAAAWAEGGESPPSYSEDYYFKFEIVDPRPGPYEATIKRWITNNPSSIRSANPITYIPQPITESVGALTAWATAHTAGNRSFAAAKEWSIPSTIHDTISIPYETTGSYQSSLIFTRSLGKTPGYDEWIAQTDIIVDYDIKPVALGLYEVGVISINIANLYETYTGSEGGIIGSYDEELVTEQPTALTVTQLDNDRVKVEWAAATAPTLFCHGYKVYLRGGFSEGVELRREVENDQFSVILTGQTNLTRWRERIYIGLTAVVQPAGQPLTEVWSDEKAVDIRLWDMSPDPKPPTFATPPTAVSSTSVTMTANPSTIDPAYSGDVPTVEVRYKFECIDDPSASSVWQPGLTYTPTGLTPNSLYTFKLYTKDTNGNELIDYRSKPDPYPVTTPP